MSVEFHKWELIWGRISRPVLRLWDCCLEEYISQPGYVDAFNSPEAAQLAATYLGIDLGEDDVQESVRVFDPSYKKVSGRLYLDPIRQGPFRSPREAVRAAEECRWDETRDKFLLEPDVLAKLSAQQQLTSMQAQREIAEFIQTYMYKADGSIAVRECRVLGPTKLRAGKRTAGKVRSYRDKRRREAAAEVHGGCLARTGAGAMRWGTNDDCNG